MKPEEKIILQKVADEDEPHTFKGMQMILNTLERDGLIYLSDDVGYVITRKGTEALNTL